MKVKNILICLFFSLILIGVGFYFWWISPPLGSNFEMWQDANLAWEEVEQENVVFSFVGYQKTKKVMQDEENGDVDWIECDIINNSMQLFFYDDQLYKIDYYYMWNWHTIYVSSLSIQLSKCCDANVTVREKFYVPKEVMEYSGKYRLYLLNVGFLEFEIE